MADSHRHIINKVLVDVNLPSSLSGDRQSATRQIEAGVQSALNSMDETMNRNFSPNWYQLETLVLDVDIGAESLHGVEGRIQELLKSELQKLASARDGKSARVNEKNSGPEAYSQEERWRKLFSYFLAKGFYPWWAGSDENLPALEAWLTELPAGDWRELIASLHRDNRKRVCRRLSGQFSEPLVQRMIGNSLGDSAVHDSLNGYIHEFKKYAESLKMPAGRIQQMTRRLYEIIFATVLPGIVGDSDAAIRGLFLDLTRAALSDIARFSTAAETDRESWKHHLSEMKTSRARSWLKLLNEFQADPDESPTDPDESRTDPDESQSHPGRRPDMESGSRSDKVDLSASKHMEEVEYPVPQAGLVLLNPFIENLFARLELTEKNRFCSEYEKERAVCILHYLATGEESFEEQKLVLPKMLCDWPLENPVNRFMSLGKDEKKECLSVLESSISHWPALKRTSPEGLQLNFLWRSGVLKKEAFGWSLYVEHKTEDILLHKLPWGFSVIRFTWMDEMITVNWQEAGNG